MAPAAEAGLPVRQPAAEAGLPVRQPGWLYVYYRVAGADLPAAVAAVRRLQDGLQATHPGLQAALLRRPGLQGDQATLMETYDHPGGLPETLQAAITEAAQQALAPWLQGERHNELFVPLI